VEIAMTFRGSTPISVEHFNVDDMATAGRSGTTGFLVPARLFLWRPKRVQTERLSFD
jgi:hypothetical protein